MQELKYRFAGVGIHEALIVQQAIEARITGMTVDLKGTEKQIKAVVEELETMYDDLNRHIAAIEREQYFYEKSQVEGRMNLKNNFSGDLQGKDPICWRCDHISQTDEKKTEEGLRKYCSECIHATDVT
jgi:hypothetical protein